jgi:hypothetical protein
MGCHGREIMIAFLEVRLLFHCLTDSLVYIRVPCGMTMGIPRPITSADPIHVVSDFRSLEIHTQDSVSDSTFPEAVQVYQRMGRSPAMWSPIGLGDLTERCGEWIDPDRRERSQQRGTQIGGRSARKLACVQCGDWLARGLAEAGQRNRRVISVMRPTS